jgi:hypothetical protein
MGVDTLEEDTSQHMEGTFLLMMYRSGEVILAEEGMEYLVAQVIENFSLLNWK